MKKILKIGSTLGAWAALGVSTALAQVGTTTTTTPGVPDTGAGGDIFTNLLLLGVSAAIVIVGLVYLARTRAASQVE